MRALRQLCEGEPEARERAKPHADHEAAAVSGSAVNGLSG